MHKTAVLLLFLFNASLLLASPVDPAAAIQRARDLVSAKQYAAAVDALKGAVQAAQTLPEADRTQAVAAVHFYTAVALAGLKSDTDAKAHLLEFLTLVPNARLNPEKYDPHFVSLFNDVQGRNDPNAKFRFDIYYPGFDPSVTPAADNEDPSAWGGSPALAILGSRQEKQEWSAATSAPERAAFIEAFWRKRDSHPETPENEFRAIFNHRVAFADKAFASSELRGATTDRGKVFILLGPPSTVRRRPLTQRDPVVIYDSGETIVNGLVEQWVYAPRQLPIRIPKDSVTYRFVTQTGIGDGVLQQEDPFAFKALMVAMNPNEEKK